MNNVKKIDKCEITNDLISWSVTAGFSENAKEKLENETDQRRSKMCRARQIPVKLQGINSREKSYHGVGGNTRALTL